jgi:hypothetical protein
MFVNWWDNPTNPDSWFKHQVRLLCAFVRACVGLRSQRLSLSLNTRRNTHTTKPTLPPNKTTARVVGRRLLGRRVLHHARRQQEGGGAQGARGRRRRALERSNFARCVGGVRVCVAGLANSRL